VEDEEVRKVQVALGKNQERENKQRKRLLNYEEMVYVEVDRWLYERNKVPAEAEKYEAIAKITRDLMENKLHIRPEEFTKDTFGVVGAFLRGKDGKAWSKWLHTYPR
jgi:hypothetical protein